MLRFVGEAICHRNVLTRRRTGLWLGRRNCFLPVAFERGQHCDRSNDRFALHDVARSRNAATISSAQSDMASPCGHW